MEIRLQTLTPLWTGGVDQSCDRLHETGLIGSLRWWYEALVRGLGGFACDPTAEGRCEYNSKNPLPPEQQLCAVCYLFGCTGWARLFRLQIVEVQVTKIPLHFYTTLPANKRWLGSIFGGEKRNNRIDGMTVPFGKLRLDLVTRGQDDEYALGQFVWALEFAARNGGLGAKLQHGFGQVGLLTPLTQHTVVAEQKLKDRLREFRSHTNDPTYPTRQQFFSYQRMISAKHSVLTTILAAERIGSAPPASTFVPCVFDLRYKGEADGKQLGFRQWLVEQEWAKQDITALLGETRARRDEERAASRIYFGMPWQNKRGDYTLRVFGFVPPSLDTKKVNAEVKAYLNYLFGAQGGQ